jgi:hypothetical protein
MNKREISYAILAVCLLLLGWWFVQTAQHKSPIVTTPSVAPNLTTNLIVSNTTVSPSTVTASNNAIVQTRVGPHGIRLFKSTNYPPQTAEEKAQWKWWDAMDKTDPDFQWKMPIKFYGKVVDQFDQPVAEAEVELNWTTVIGPIPDPKKRISTDSDGRFEVAGIQGKRLWVAVDKQGYLYSSNSVSSFEYAAFFNDNFYVPDPNNPVVFRLQKLMGAEPMYKYLPYGETALGGAPLILNVEKGKVAAQGDLSFSVALGAETNRNGSDFIVTMQGLNGAGFVFSDEEFLFKAPESGYENIFTVTHKVNVPNYRPEQILRFYVRTGTGKYAAAEVKISLWGDLSRADFRAILYYNPSGSRNLEFDQNKWINR